ncbi:MAG: chemotaxis protein CheX [Spirochaetales bacterium]|nr:chemotaxis protein CheX [Spirochaetales bacterium]
MDNYYAYFSRALCALFEETGLGDCHEKGSGKKTSFEVITNIGVTGQVKGCLMMKTDFRTASEISNSMLSGIGHSENEEGFTSMQKAAITEFTNQFGARAIMFMSDDGIDCNITPPTIITGQTVESQTFQITQAVEKEFSSPFGSIFLYLGLQ